jgi:hypothetical protein
VRRADLPAVETSFRRREPGRRYVRVDEPVDELGRSFGLRFRTNAPAEDMAGGGPFRSGPPDATVAV